MNVEQRTTQSKEQTQSNGVPTQWLLIGGCPTVHGLLKFSNLPRLEAHAPKLTNFDVVNYVSASHCHTDISEFQH